MLSDPARRQPEVFADTICSEEVIVFVSQDIATFQVGKLIFSVFAIAVVIKNTGTYAG